MATTASARAKIGAKARPRRAPARLSARFAGLVKRFPPRAISDDAHLEKTLGVIDRLMALGRLTADQAQYMETLVQLVQAYESAKHRVQPLAPADVLRHLLEENGMSATDLARLLGVHASMGSKILRGERALTVEHMKALGAHFRVSPGAFIG